jgi:hypothetical protein
MQSGKQMGTVQAIAKLKEGCSQDYTKAASVSSKKRKMIHFIAEQDGICLPPAESAAWAEALESIAAQIRKNLDGLEREKGS